jgi:uncharacterized membrane protein
MGTASATQELPGPVSAAEALWYDQRRWPSFVDGFAHVQKSEGDWPKDGARIIWQSGPDGRGTVAERVTRYEVRSGQTVEIEDPRITGEQKVTFKPAEDGRSTITVELTYRLKERTPFTPIVDALFVRRAMTDAIRRTLARFARELRGDLELERGGP